MSFEFQVFVKNCSKTSVFKVTSDMKLSDFKNLIEERICFPPSGYYLIHSGKLLTDNDFKLSEYKISKDSTIHFHYRDIPYYLPSISSEKQCN